MSTNLVLNAEEFAWIQPPNHFGAYSKMLINQKSCGSKQFDFRVSIYQPMGYVAEHVHEISEQIYYIIRGTGLMTLDGEQFVVKENNAIFIPPGVRHSISNTGFVDLVFVLVTTPPEE